MALSPAQKATLKADIAANNALAGGASIYATTAIKDVPATSDGNIAVADFYNRTASPAFFVYRPSVPVQELYDAITWANLTPSAAPDTTQQWANRSLACQGKQFNLQTILIGSQGALNAAKANVRAGLQDALTGIPSGTGGATQAAGWVAVRDTVLARSASWVEKLFSAGGNGSTPAQAGTMGLEGPITAGDIDAVRNS